MTSRLAVLVSGTGTNLQAIIDATVSEELAADVVVVVSNKPGAPALRRAADRGIPALALCPNDGETRHNYDARLADLVACYQPDWIVLAGWMRIVSRAFLARFPNRVINLHPALPGDLPGLHAIERAHAEAERGLRTSTGAMVHMVDEGVDTGPVVATVDVPVFAGEPLVEFEARMHAAEHRLLVAALTTLTDMETTDG
jgi:formyltetrahydrofolate-dependent phosphoribosylglycinamide formyltransferase